MNMECAKTYKNGSKCQSKATFTNVNNVKTCKLHRDENSYKLSCKNENNLYIFETLFPNLTSPIDLSNAELYVKNQNISNYYSSICLEQMYPNLFVPTIKLDNNLLFKKTDQYFIAAREFYNEINITQNVDAICDFIEILHFNKFSSGNFDKKSFKLVDDTIRLNNANSLMKCINVHGDPIEIRNLDIADNVKLYSAARNVMNNQSPNRLDDFESLFYLVLMELRFNLPWSMDDKSSCILNYKTKFIENPIEYTDDANIIQICKYLHETFESDRPKYNKLKNMFRALL